MFPGRRSKPWPRSDNEPLDDGRYPKVKEMGPRTPKGPALPQCFDRPLN